MLKQLLLIIRIYLEKLIDLIFGFLFECQAKKIPDLKKSQSILLESAVSLASKIRSKQLKAEDLMRSTIDRIKDVSFFLVFCFHFINLLERGFIFLSHGL